MLTKLTEWLRAERQSLRVVGTFLFLIVAFFFLLSWEPIVKRVDIGSALAHLVAWASFAVLKVVGFVDLTHPPASDQAFDTEPAGH